MSSWQSVLMPPETTLAEAIGIIDLGALRIGLVVAPDGRLLGTVTDGDIRRAMIRKLGFESPVASVMCATPRTARRDWPRERMLSVMEGAKILHLPLVDDAGRLVGLETLQGALEHEVQGNPVFLMAGGFGSRLQPLTQACPKPMLRVGDKPILELILDGFIAAGFRRFYISTHYMPEMISDHFGDGSRWGVTIRYIHEEQPLGTGGALGLLPHDEITEPMFVMNGDLLTNVDYRGLLEFHRDQGSVATMCVREVDFQVPYGVVYSDGAKVTSMVEKPLQKFLVNAGIYLLSPEFVRSVAPGVRVDMPSLLEQQLAAGGAVSMYPVHEYWMDIGRVEDLRRAQLDFGGERDG